MELDTLDRKAAQVFDGFIVRKDLVCTFSRQYPVPTYVVEFFSGRYCASIAELAIEKGATVLLMQVACRKHVR